MKVTLRRIFSREEEQVIIECVEITPEIEEIHAYVSSKGTGLSGIENGKLTRFRLEDVFYFEAVDDKVYAYTEKKVYEMKLRLYEAEAAYERNHFVRCSRSAVLNLMKLESISPARNGRFLAHMQNGEKLIISRQYITGIRKKVIGGKADER